MIGRRWLVVITAACGTLGPLPRIAAQSQATVCDLRTVSPRGGIRTEQIPGVPGMQNAWAGGGVQVVCRSRGITITSDSAEQWGAEGKVVMIGHVHYVETARLDLTANFLYYFQKEERVVASLDVHATQLSNGSRLEGALVTLWRQMPSRPRQQIKAEGSPLVTIPQKDSAGVVVDTVAVRSSTLFMDGDDLVYAGGQVVIRRSDLTATGDSAALDSKQETMKLMRNPMIDGQRGRKYRLSGQLIDAYSSNRKLRRVIARGAARATAGDITLTADTLDLRVANDQVDHAFAWGRTAPARVTTPRETMTADSLDILMPGQRVRRVLAIGAALVEALPDSARFRTSERDWLRGDTVLAVFDSLAPADTANPPLRRITAAARRAEARAYYHVVASDTASRLPAINYVVGRRIALEFAARQLMSVTVRDSVAGIYAEPIDSTRRGPKGGAGHAVPRELAAGPPGRSDLPPPLTAPRRRRREVWR